MFISETIIRQQIRDGHDLKIHGFEAGKYLAVVEFEGSISDGNLKLNLEVGFRSHLKTNF